MIAGRGRPGEHPAGARLAAVGLALRSLVAVAVLLAGVAVTAGPGYLALLAAGGAVAALIAALQVRHDDVLGWLSAASVAAPVAAMTVAAHSSGLPGSPPAEWSLPAVGLLVTALVTVATSSVAAVLPLTGPDGTDGDQQPQGGGHPDTMADRR
jgi:hypothetical protein